jgi:multimeric flavodoxin WrbA
MAEQTLAALAGNDVVGEHVRLVDLNIKPGVELDMGAGDDWPDVRAKIMAADILVVATPTWLG